MTRFSPPQQAHAPLFAALPRLYYVGGCVRNGLLGLPSDDYDFACGLVPEEMVTTLQHAGIKTVPTGLAHGTVTAVLAGVGLEITAFRADVHTDGRHAQVRFGSTLEEDSQRRDFTVNALYAHADGTVIDPVGGLPDLQQGLIRFIGDPEERIREDYLRILRFFRFYAGYGRTAPDAPALAACARLREGLQQLSRERICKEVLKTLATPDPRPTLQLMHETGVWQTLFGTKAEHLDTLHPVRAETRLALWMPMLSPEDLDRRLRLTGAQIKHLTSVRALAALPLDHDTQVRAARLEHPAEAVHEALLIRRADPSLLTIAAEPARAMPVTGHDLKRLGIAGGAPMGEALRRLRSLWVAGGLHDDRERLLREGGLLPPSDEAHA